MAKNNRKNKLQPVAETVQQPWEPTRPYLKDILGQAEGMHQSGQAGQNPWLQPTAEGAYLGNNGNPYLQQLYSQGADDIQRRIASTYSGMGRYASGAHDEALGRSLGSLYTGINAPAYESERGRQFQAQAAMQTPQDVMSWYTDLVNSIGGMGGTATQFEKNTPFLNFIKAIATGVGAASPRIDRRVI